MLLSNSSKRRAQAISNLAKMGLPPPGDRSLYFDIITSGEITQSLVTSGRAALTHPAITPGSKVFVFGSGDDDAGYVSSLGCELAGPAACDWVLARGNFVLVRGAGEGGVVKIPGGDPSDNFQAQTRYFVSAASGLGLARSRGCPMLVANPDTIRPGTNNPMPGTIGSLYGTQGRLEGDEMGRGGDVMFVGKPHAAVYTEALRVLAESGVAVQDRGRLCAVGDAMATDIAGSGLHLGPEAGRVLVAHGIHAAALGVPEGRGQKPEPEAVERFVAPFEEGNRPTHVVPAFVW